MKETTLNQLLKLCEKIERDTNMDECDEFCFYASHKCEDAEDTKIWKRVSKVVGKTIISFEKNSAAYLKKLNELHEAIDKNTLLK